MIYILVPTFARVKETKIFLSSINQSIKHDYLTIIIDDHPQKETLKSIEQNDNLNIFSSKKELWWVGSINMGIQILFDKHDLKDEDIVVFANNDIEIDKKSFELLYNELKKNKTQIVHPRTFDQNENEVSSGARIISFFPYITRHPIDFTKEKEVIDMGTARFLMMGGSVLNQVGYINPSLVQYGGDNDFTLSAKRLHNINTYILRDAICILEDSFTGIKNHNIKNLKELFKSFLSIKSPNNMKYRYILFKKFFGNTAAFFISASMLLNTIVKFVIKKK
ncbi:MAG: glycosyltransferase family 2 protein [Euryarchaeota archaeon TMED85]|nr:MAG: glycosyltransferase family 2 protein [Euryarchaeota archaeon TMED85]